VTSFVQMASPVATLSSTFHFYSNSVAVYTELAEASLTSEF